MDQCPWCGEPATFEITEVFLETREIELDSCCEANLNECIDSIRLWTRRERARWMLLQSGIRVRDLIVDGEALSWVLDYGVRLEPIEFGVAKEFIREHHRHLRPPRGWKFGMAAFNGDEMVGVMSAGRPVSPVLQAKGCLEINRVCVKDNDPSALGKDACSLLYGYACREGFQRGYRRVITYTLMSESGASLRAAGFVPVAITSGGSWNRKKRPREDNAPTEPKIRWERWKDAATLPKQLCLPMAA